MEKRVLFIASVVKKHILQFHIPYLKWFKERGYIVDVCAGNDFDPKEKKYIPYCDNYYETPFYRTIATAKNYTSYKEVKRLADKNEYTLIHCHTPIAAAIARTALRKKHKSGTTVLYTTHGFHFYKGCPKVYKLYYLAEKYLINYTDGIITINSEDYDAAKKICEGKKCKVFIIPGIGAQLDKVTPAFSDKRAALRKEFGIPNDAFLIMSNSEINQNKNVELSVRAAAKIDGAYMLVCGNGSMLDSCKELAKSLGVGDRILFAGYRYDAKRLLGAADAFIFPSRREGLGMAAIEAMAAGLPLIAAANRGTLEYAEDGVNALLYAPDDFMGFCGAIRRLKDDRELCVKLGENGKKTAQAYELSNAVRAMTEIYEQMLPA